MKQNKKYLDFQDEAQDLFADCNLRITSPNSGMELSYDDHNRKFIIINCGEDGDETETFTSFEKAIDFMLENH